MVTLVVQNTIINRASLSMHSKNTLACTCYALYSYNEYYLYKHSLWVIENITAVKGQHTRIHMYKHAASP